MWPVVVLCYATLFNFDHLCLSVVLSLKNNTKNQELTAIKARVLEMEEESERLKEEERCDVGDMQLLATSPRPGEITFLFQEL